MKAASSARRRCRRLQHQNRRPAITNAATTDPTAIPATAAVEMPVAGLGVVLVDVLGVDGAVVAAAGVLNVADDDTVVEGVLDDDVVEDT